MKMKLNTLFLIFTIVFTLSSSSIFGQIVIQGKVGVSGSIEVLPNALVMALKPTVLVDGTSDLIKGTVTDEYGHFKMKISNQSYKLKAICVGYQMQILPSADPRINYDNSLDIDIYLRGDIATAVSWAEYNMYRAICEQFDFENDNFETF